MGEHKNGPLLKTVGVLGVAILLMMSYQTAFHKIPGALNKMKETKKEETSLFTHPEINSAKIHSVENMQEFSLTKKQS